MTDSEMMERVLQFQKLLTDRPDLLEQLPEENTPDPPKPKAATKRAKLIAKTQTALPLFHPGLKGWHPCEGGLVGFLDRFRVYATTDTFGYAQAGEPRDLDHLIPQGVTHPLTIDLNRLKIHIKEQKALVKAKERAAVHSADYEVEGFTICFNPVQLEEFCEFFGTDTIYVIDSRSPAQYWNPDTGEWGLLLPCRVSPERG